MIICVHVVLPPASLPPSRSRPRSMRGLDCGPGPGDPVWLRLVNSSEIGVAEAKGQMYLGAPVAAVRPYEQSLTEAGSTNTATRRTGGWPGFRTVGDRSHAPSGLAGEGVPVCVHTFRQLLLPSPDPPGNAAEDAARPRWTRVRSTGTSRSSDAGSSPRPRCEPGRRGVRTLTSGAVTSRMRVARRRAAAQAAR